MNSAAKLYDRAVNAKWPTAVPLLEAEEARRAALRLHRKFLGKPFAGKKVAITSGRNHSYIRAGVLRVNPSRGWLELVHGLSHSFFRRLHPKLRPHDSRHLYLERDMAEFVLASGWLDGKLKAAAKPVLDRDSLELERILAGLERWDAKARRAKNAIAKLEKRRKYYAKKIAAKVQS